MCDTDYTRWLQRWPPDPLVHKVLELFEAAAPFPGVTATPLVVISGGEPLRQFLSPFIGLLQQEGCLVQIETNGTLKLPPDGHVHRVNWPYVDIVCSPKTGRVNKKLERFITAYKYVVTAGDVSEEDGLPLHALDHPASPRLARPRERFPIERIYVQPMDPDPDSANLQACLNACYRFGYTLSLQQHKIIGVP
jgi:7-carboxy-7-deazaguanine synthase